MIINEMLDHDPDMFCGFRYLALESMCLLAASEFSHDAVKKHQDTVIAALKVHHQGCVS